MGQKAIEEIEQRKLLRFKGEPPKCLTSTDCCFYFPKWHK